MLLLIINNELEGLEAKQKWSWTIAVPGQAESHPQCRVTAAQVEILLVSLRISTLMLEE
jgi:hypothetical protein